MRFVLRFVSFLALVFGTLVASVDAIQSVSASQPVLTPLSSAIAAGGASALSMLQSLERPHPDGSLFDPAIRWSLQQPAFAFLFLVALALWVVAYQRPQPAGRFSA